MIFRVSFWFVQPSDKTQWDGVKPNKIDVINVELTVLNTRHGTYYEQPYISHAKISFVRRGPWIMNIVTEKKRTEGKVKAELLREILHEV